MLFGWIWRNEKFERRPRDLVGRGWRFSLARTPTHPPARCQYREKSSSLAVHTTAFGRVLVMPVASLALYYGQSNNLTWLGQNEIREVRRPPLPNLASDQEHRLAAFRLKMAFKRPKEQPKAQLTTRVEFSVGPCLVKHDRKKTSG
jgi:hypothetical protein